MDNVIYLDNNATTPLDPRVLDKMMPFFKEDYGNASSRHVLGNRAYQAIKKARTQVADLIGSEDYEIIFTSGATEAINTALKGVSEFHEEKRNHIVTVCTEHPAVIDTCNYLQHKGFDVTFLPVQNDGLIDLSILENAITENTAIVSVMLVNNETGVIQPIKEISDLAHEKGAIFMTDATEAVGKIPVNVNELGIDILSLSAHKFYGPKGIGALYIRSRRPNRVNLVSLLHGGGHERNLRSGTLNTPGIIGIGKACEIAKKEMSANEKKIGELRDILENELLKMNDVFLNGIKAKRIYNTSSICFKGVDADAIIIGLENICVSNGSACSSNSFEPSHVLKGMGMSDEEAFSTVRFSMGKYNSENGIQKTVHKIKDIIQRLRIMNPLQ
jgi:cysteine desulfurase